MRYDVQNVQSGEGVAPCSDVVFEGLFRGNLEAMAISDADDHRFADVNAAFLEKLGYARGEILGKTGADLGLFADVEQWRRGMEDLIRIGNIRSSSSAGSGASDFP